MSRRRASRAARRATSTFDADRSIPATTQDRLPNSADIRSPPGEWCDTRTVLGLLAGSYAAIGAHGKAPGQMDAVSFKIRENTYTEAGLVPFEIPEARSR
ncbi:hypothetical protein Kisp02_25340 [Kineosporia sp. NBRC 101731]|nr:hypothetical protein Kisp02_25340 [Kineosporia sp. NBRC 101731]